jgi:hypothetical protein
LLTFPTAVYRREARRARNLVHTRTLHIQVHSLQLGGSCMKAGRREPCCRRSQDRSLIVRALAPARFLHSLLRNGCDRDDGARDCGVRACGDHGYRGLCLPTHGLWALTRAG